MRTTLDIEDDVLAAVKALARQQGETAGEVLSALAQSALTGTGAVARGPRASYGFRPFADGEAVVTNEVIDDLRDRESS